MNKISIITDTHFGIHRNSDEFLDSQLKFFNNQFFPYLESNKIDHIFFLGDLFDNRNTINNKIKNSVYDLFEKLNKFNVYMIVGNHDSYYNDRLDVNSLKYFNRFENIKIIDNSLSTIIYDRNFFFSPWQITENINFQDAEVCLGHFDIIGFNFNKFKVNEKGMSESNFDKYKLTFSGHFHCRSIKDKIIYVGSPYQLDRNDIDDKRGFLVLDCKDLSYEFIDNDVSLKYIRIKYPNKIEKKEIEGNIVDIDVNYDKDYSESDFQFYLREVEKYNPIGQVTIRLVNNFLKDSDINIDKEIFISVESLIEKYLSKIEVKNKEEIRKILFDIYNSLKGIEI